MVRRAAVILVAIASLVCVPSALAQHGASFVQGATNTGSGTSLTSSYNLGVVGGDDLVAQVRGSGTVSVSDNQDGAWTKLADDSGAGGVGSLWAYTNAKGGSTTVTITASTSGTIRIVQAEYAGAGAVDGTPACSDGTGTTATTPSVSGTVGDLQFASVGMFGSDAISAGSGSALHDSLNNSAGSTADEDVVAVSSATGSQTFGLGSAPSGGWAACAVDFRPGAGAFFVQGNTATGSGTSLTSAYSLSVAAGDDLMAVVSGSGTVSVSDNRDGAWTEVGTARAAASLWTYAGAAGGSTTVTVSATTSGAMRIVQADYTGAGIKDAAASCHSGTGTTVSIPAVAATTGDLQFAIVGTDGSETITAGSGSVLRNHVATTGGSSADEDILSTASGSASQTFTLSSAPPTGWSACAADFKQSSPIGGNGTRIFSASFNLGSGPQTHYPSQFGTCGTGTTTDQATFTIDSSCNPGGDGHYRTDWCTASGCNGNATVADGDVYQSGTATCTSIPVKFTSMPVVPTSSWVQFAEAKDWSADSAGWGMGLTSYYAGTSNELEIGWGGYGSPLGNAPWTGPIPAGWNTLSECDNNSNSASTGTVYGIYLNGERLTMNHAVNLTPGNIGWGRLSGFAIIRNGQSSWPLDINDYTGGSPNNTLIHGTPIVAYIGSNGLPPEPSRGWSSP